MIMKEVVIGDNFLYTIVNKRKLIMKKILVFSALSLFSLNQEALAMFQEENKDFDYSSNQSLTQKTQFDIDCEEKFKAEQEYLKKKVKIASKMLGLDKQKKKNSKHLK